MDVDLEKLAKDLGEAWEAINSLSCQSIDSEALKQLALKVGVDHTREPHLVMEAIGERFDDMQAHMRWRGDLQVYVDGKLFDIDMPRKASNAWTYDPNLGWITPVIVTSKERPW